MSKSLLLFVLLLLGSSATAQIQLENARGITFDLFEETNGIRYGQLHVEHFGLFNRQFGPFSLGVLKKLKISNLDCEIDMQKLSARSLEGLFLKFSQFSALAHSIEGEIQIKIQHPSGQLHISGHEFFETAAGNIAVQGSLTLETHQHKISSKLAVFRPGEDFQALICDFPDQHLSFKIPLFKNEKPTSL